MGLVQDFIAKNTTFIIRQYAATCLFTSPPSPYFSCLHGGVHQPDCCWRDWSWQLSQELPHHWSRCQLCFNNQLHLHLYFQANSRDFHLCDEVMHPMLPNRRPHWQPPGRQIEQEKLK